MTVLRIGNASGFYGDRFTAWREMLDGGDLDVLTGDYLAELTMLILGRDKTKDPSLGYAKTFLRQLEGCLGTALDKKVALVTNAGGVNPAGLADKIRDLGESLGLRPRVALVEGAPVGTYFGAFGIAECLKAGADIVVTGRVTDASLVVGPAIARFGWTREDYDQLAGATIAGHILECGAQATGGNYSFFTELPDRGRRPGFPLAEIRSDGSSVITKHAGTGGAVTVETVTAQLLYEIESPAYLGPDVVTHIDTVALAPDGPDRVLVSGVRGSPPPPTLKVGTTRLGGWRNSVVFVLCGLSIEDKAALVQEQLTAAIGTDGVEFRLARTDHPDSSDQEAASALLHVLIKDSDPRRAGRAFTAAAVELALASYPGCTMTAPPADPAPYGVFTATSTPQVEHHAVLPDVTRVPIPPPTRTAPAPVPAAPGLRSGATREGVASEAPGPARAEASAIITARAEASATVPTPLGAVVGARSGDKGADANLGVWARDDAAYRWLRSYLSVDELKRLLPETATLTVERYELANLRAVNFVLRGLLGDGGVAASTRFDPQGKALGEWLRSRVVAVPTALRVAGGEPLVSEVATTTDTTPKTTAEPTANQVGV